MYFHPVLLLLALGFLIVSIVLVVTLVNLYARVEQHINYVHYSVCNNNQDCENQSCAHYQVIVSIAYCGDKKSAHTRHRIDKFDYK